MKWCSVSQMLSKPSSSVHAICSISCRITSGWVIEGGACKKQSVPNRIGRLAHRALEIDEQRRVVAETTSRATDGSAPVVADVAKARPELVIHEGLIETKSIAAVR